MNAHEPITRLPTGINGFDQVALGGLPVGRPTLVSGTTGSGKTVFAIEFLARGILNFGEPGSSSRATTSLPLPRGVADPPGPTDPQSDE